jgi:hypothetical protein
LLFVKEKDLPKGKPNKDAAMDMVKLEKNKDDCALFLSKNNQPVCFPRLYKPAIPNSGQIEDLMLRGLIKREAPINSRAGSGTCGKCHHHRLDGELLIPH